MAKRPSWTGFLKLSLVTCPIQLFNATTRSESVSFHFIHAAANRAKSGGLPKTTHQSQAGGQAPQARQRALISR